MNKTVYLWIFIIAVVAWGLSLGAAVWAHLFVAACLVTFLLLFLAGWLAQQYSVSRSG